MSWQESCIGPHIELVSGPPFQSSRFSDDASNVALIKGENIGQGEILWEKSKYWPSDDVEKYERFKLVPGDIVLAMDRPWVPAGLKFAVIRQGDPDALLVQRVARLRGTQGLRPGFLRHIVASRAFERYLKNIMGGTNVPHISGDQIRAFKCRLPPPLVQQRIADVLSAYDDLIANNRRRIQLLEESTRLLFREWFVMSRFPGHEHTRISDGVPQGWKRVPLPDVAEINRQSLPSNFDGDILYIDISSVEPGRIIEKAPMIYREAPGRARRVLSHGDVLWSCVRPNRRSHAIVWNPEPHLIGSTGFAVLTPVKVPTSYLYSVTTTNEFVGFLTSNAQGAAYPAVTASVFERAMILVPTESLLEEFDRVVSPSIELADKLAKQSATLRDARDLLLPRLMSGELGL